MGFRWACAAGTFYPADPVRLSREIERCLGGTRADLGPEGPPLVRPVGLILPHAGYRYSGTVAGAGFRTLWRTGRPEVALILGTHHTGLGPPLAVAEPGEWETPFGPMPVHEDLARRVARATGAELSEAPFRDEHSVEVQLPFLRYLYGELPFVACVVQPLAAEEAERAGRALAQVLADQPVALLCSTDFTHYEPHAVAKEKDLLALRHVLDLDLPGFLEAVRARRISICGVGALALFVATARSLNLRAAELLLYRTSGEIAGMMDQVVGYAAALFREANDVA